MLNSIMTHPAVKHLKSNAFFIGTSITAIVISLPLLGHQFPHPELGLLWYPIFFAAFTLLIVKGLTRASGLDGTFKSLTKPYQKILAGVACFCAGFFAPWFATIGPEVLGNNSWQGNVLTMNLISSLTGAVSGIWAAFAIRLLKRPLSAPRVFTVLSGCIVIQLIWVFSERINNIDAFWTFLGQNYEYASYFLLEALAGQVAWPLALLTCLWYGVFLKE